MREIICLVIGRNTSVKCLAGNCERHAHVHILAFFRIWILWQGKINLSLSCSVVTFVFQVRNSNVMFLSTVFIILIAYAWVICIQYRPTENHKHYIRCLLINIHLVVCLTTGPKSLPKRALHIVRSRASSFKWEYLLLSLRSSSRFLHLLSRRPITSIPPFIFPSITCCRRQFLCKMWPIQFAFRLRISCRIFLCSLTLSNTSSFLTWSVQLISSILLQQHISKLSRCFWSTARSVKVSAPYKATLQM